MEDCDDVTSHLRFFVLLPLGRLSLGAFCLLNSPHIHDTEQWSEHYGTLVSEQRRLISGKRYAACRDKSVNPTVSSVKTVKTEPTLASSIPRDVEEGPATLVTARLTERSHLADQCAHVL